MAKLTDSEREELRQRGIFVSQTTEKCDICFKPILSLTYKKGTQVLCPGCKGGVPRVPESKKEEKKERTEMAKAKKEEAKIEEGSKKLAGCIVRGTAMAALYELLEDEKKHPLATATKLMEKFKVEPTHRFRRLKEIGQEKGHPDKGPWTIILDEDTIQLKFGKVAASTNGKPNGKAKAKEEEEPDGKVSKAQAAVAKLVRRTLQSKDDWTKNKLVEHLQSEHALDPKVVQAAIDGELKAGGLTTKGGVLSLA